ncbi:MAG: NADH-quinone oxidoreductase subunit NuoG [Desulfuromonadales bacterium]
MPKLTIDNREVNVPEGTNVLEAARALDIVIPHFCYHEALGAVGSCRLCAMMFVDGPVKGLQMACMIQAQDGMVVSSADPNAVELRAHVIEWAMMDHPHDCPICDEGGECQLQEMTVAGGHSVRRYRGRKKTFINQDLGPFVQQEMNRCITCYRCVRTYRDYCGGTDYGVFGSRNRVFYGRFQPGKLESPFSGNIIDACPTGVLTSKPFRYKTRLWDLQEAPSICPHCSLGCATIPGGRYREVQRVRAGINRETNGFFICDRGRFGYDHVNHPERPRQPRVDGREVPFDVALAAAREQVAGMVEKHGPDSVAFLGSAYASLEANYLLRDWAAATGCSLLVYEAHQVRDTAARTLVARHDGHASSLEDIRQSDLIILVGADPLAEGPMLALAIRQAARNGGKVMVIDPRPVDLPCDTDHLSLPPERLPGILEALSRMDSNGLEPCEREQVSSLLEQLGSARRPVLVGGADLLGGQGVLALCVAAEALTTLQRMVGVMVLLSGPNSYGGALLAGDGPAFETVLDAIQEGTVRGLVCLESDPFREAMDPARAQAALGHLELLVSIDATPTLAAQRADIFLPARANAEMPGSYMNNEGRLQAFLPVIEPGLPISETGGGDHPPREFFQVTPGSAPEADWWILARLLEREADLAGIRRSIEHNDDRFVEFQDLAADTQGLRLTARGSMPPVMDNPLPHDHAAGALKLLSIAAPVGSHWLSHLSSPLAATEPRPHVCLHPESASEVGLADGDRARLTTRFGHCHVMVHVERRVVKGLVLVPQLWDTALEGMVPGSMHSCRLEKEVQG